MNRNELIVVKGTDPNGYTNYCLANQDKTLRYTCYTLFKDDLKNLHLFAEPMPLKSNIYVLV